MFQIPSLSASYSSEDQKEAFIGFQDSDFNEGLLDLHEKELDFLKIYYEDHQKLFQVSCAHGLVVGNRCTLEYSDTFRHCYRPYQPLTILFLAVGGTLADDVDAIPRIRAESQRSESIQQSRRRSLTGLAGLAY